MKCCTPPSLDVKSVGVMFPNIWRTRLIGQDISAALQFLIITLFVTYTSKQLHLLQFAYYYYDSIILIVPP